MTMWVSRYQDLKSFCILLQQENMEMAEVTIRTVNVKSSSQIITSNIPTMLLFAGLMPFLSPTNSVNALKTNQNIQQQHVLNYHFIGVARCPGD